MKAVLLVIGAIALTMACLSAFVLVGMSTTGAVRDTLEALNLADDTTTATASSGQKATAVCVGVLNWRNCNIEQESTTEVSQQAASMADDAVMGFVMFGMLFVGAGFVAMLLGAFLFGPSESW
jgi:hypothetical protein